MDRINLINACAIGDLEKVKLIINSGGVNLDYKKFDGSSALIEAVQNYRYEIIKLLLESRADVNIQQKNGDTPLIIAIDLKFNEIVELLIDNKANVNTKNIYGETPLIMAACKDQIEIVEILMKNGADNRIMSQQNFTAFELSYENPEIMFLIKNQEVNYQDDKGNTLLIEACQIKHVEYALFLMDKGADFFVKNNNNISAYDVLISSDNLPPKFEALKQKLILEQDCDEDYRPTGGL